VAGGVAARAGGGAALGGGRVNLHLCVALLCLGLGPAPSLERGLGAAAESWFAEDKLKHFVSSYFVTVVAGTGARALGADAGAALRIGVGVGLGAGIAKEVHDQRRPEGHPSVRDLVWNAAGVGVGGVVLRAGR
jgi:uncharacterized protein YfiM (DUF2279 family)